MTAPAFCTFDTPVTRHVCLGYLEYSPSGEQPAAGWPLILFLHGAGEKGADLEQVRAAPLPQLIEAGLDLPALVICPQCPPGLSWPVEDLQALFDASAERADVDPQRLHLTGISMGARGAWDLAYRRADRLATIVPVCGLGVPNLAPALAGLAAWIFHGEADEVVPLARSKDMADALAHAGGDVRFTALPGEGHECGAAVYGDPELWRWMFSRPLESSR